MLYTTSISTPLGSMTALADANALYLLNFDDAPHLTHKITTLQRNLGTTISTGISPVLQQVRYQLSCYFQGTVTHFTTPIQLVGSSFELHVWDTLRTIPFGSTQSYTAIAQAIGKPTAARAVGNANGANPITIIIPCHRVITAHGALGGYTGGTTRKQHLLELEHHAKIEMARASVLHTS